MKTTPKFTRADYMATTGDGDAKFTAFRRFYAQFVDGWTIAAVARYIGHNVLLASTDRHLNDIPLAWWDQIAQATPLAIRFEDVGDFCTLSGLVCVAKEAARQYIERARMEQAA
jgi:hypothetical protein